MSYHSLQDTTFFNPSWFNSTLYNLQNPSTQADTTIMLQPSNSEDGVWGVMSLVSDQMHSNNNIVDKITSVGEPWQTLMVMVVVMCLYCYILYRFRRNMISCVKNIGNMEDTMNMMEDQAADFIYFLRSGIILAILSISSLVTVWLAIRMPYIDSYYLFFGMIIISILIIIYRWLVFLVMKWMTDDKEAFVQITFINRINITFIALIYTPLAIIIGVSGELFNLGVLVFAGFILYHFIIIYKYFKIRSFSKLQLILYLCTVEILPVSFIIALAIRQSGIN